ncbi:MAG TPA: hypothetical protein PLS15_10090 [Fimbriimonadaceae bacterium]|nr:hypothetical protein [Fimbriimonadaceae bacterium]HRE92697.1 hypothetical protein [Fimbriimonadaceae bacterium]
MRLSMLALAALFALPLASAQVQNHVDPQMVIRAPGTGSDSEAGIGALIPWANKLWAVGYVAHIRGSGLGLYQVDENMKWSRHPESVTGTYANRYIHWRSKQAIIGPHFISEDGTVRTSQELAKHRLTATAAHLTNPDMVYFLTMEGILFETDVRSLASKQLFDLTKELDWAEGAYLHFKGMHTGQGRVVVANNTFEEPEHLGTRYAGRLAEWDGKGDWVILERNPFIEVSGNQRSAANDYYGSPMYAVGWDRASVILRVLHRGTWTRYRLPFGSQSWSHTWNTEWMRIRFAQTERHLMDAFGLFYDLPNLVYGGRLFGVQPISRHLRVTPDFVHYNGYFVMAGDQTDHTVGQPQSGLWWGNIDDLWSFGKPQGWGAVWYKQDIGTDETSDSYLMTGFDQKAVTLISEPNQPCVVDIEVDVLGDGSWRRITTLKADENGFATYSFPAGFSAHWVRGRARTTTDNVSLSFTYL